MAGLGILELQFENNIVRYEIPPIRLFAKFPRNTTLPEFRTKHALLVIFDKKISSLEKMGLEF